MPDVVGAIFRLRLVRQLPTLHDVEPQRPRAVDVVKRLTNGVDDHGPFESIPFHESFGDDEALLVTFGLVHNNWDVV